MKSLILFTCALVFVQCIAISQSGEKIKMIYKETVCPPQWIKFGEDKQTLLNLKNLLKQDSVELFSAKFTGTPYEMTCAGCACLTGRNIEVVIYKKDQVKLEMLDFNKPWIWMDKVELVCDWTMGLNDDEIQKKLIKKYIRVQGLYSTGLSEKKNNNCSTKSGRSFTICIDREDQGNANKEGYLLIKDFKEY